MTPEEERSARELLNTMYPQPHDKSRPTARPVRLAPVFTGSTFIVFVLVVLGLWLLARLGY